MKLEPLDIRILELLESDGRLSFREIAKKTGSTTPTVSSRVETFRNIGLIEGFTIRLSAEHFNEISILLNLECRPSDTGKLTDELKDWQEIRELYVVDGAQIHAKVTVMNQNALNDFLGRLGELDIIRNYSYKTITSTVTERGRAVLFDGLAVTIGCYYCRKPMLEAPVKLKMDGREHYLCCESCASLYKEKFLKLKEGA